THPLSLRSPPPPPPTSTLFPYTTLFRSPDDLPEVVYDPDSVSIPIQPDAHVRMFPVHSGDEITQVLRLYRVGMVMWKTGIRVTRSEEHTSELQSRFDLVCRLLLEKKNRK